MKVFHDFAGKFIYGECQISLADLFHSRLDIWTSDIVVRRAKEALATLHHDPVAIDRHDQSKVKSLEVSPDEIADSETDSNVYKRPPVQTVLPGTALRPVLLDGFIPKDSDIPSPAELSSPGFFADNELIQSWCRRQLVEGRNPVEIEGDPLLTLNTSQRRAIATMLSRNISLVQGVCFPNQCEHNIDLCFFFCLQPPGTVRILSFRLEGAAKHCLFNYSDRARPGQS
jgi:hypothetical protein